MGDVVSAELDLLCEVCMGEMTRDAARRRLTKMHSWMGDENKEALEISLDSMEKVDKIALIVYESENSMKYTNRQNLERIKKILNGQI